MFADQDFEDHTVYGIVSPIVSDTTDLGFVLTETVYPALALLVAGRIPSQIIMQYSVEMLLEINALCQAIGADENILTRFCRQICNASFPFGRRKHPRDRFDPYLGR
jgi:hypothetical protein